MSSLVRLIKGNFPPKARFTGNDLPSLKDKVFIVTGANGGIGKELTQILFTNGARVYLAARSEQKTLQAIDEIKQAVGESTSGKLKYLHLDLADLTTIRASADSFLAQENRLDVLFNNAGVAFPEAGSKTKQGYELQMGTNCLGPFLFTKFLTPLITKTAKTAPKDSVRIVWVSSSAAEAISPKHLVQGLDHPVETKVFNNYAISKIGNIFHATEAAARLNGEGVVSISLNPGNLDSGLWRHSPATVRWLLQTFVLRPVVFGAYTELFAGLSPEVTVERSGSFIAPWGNLWEMTSELSQATKRSQDGGDGEAAKFWAWCEEQVRPFA